MEKIDQFHPDFPFKRCDFKILGVAYNRIFSKDGLFHKMLVLSLMEFDTGCFILKHPVLIILIIIFHDISHDTTPSVD